MLGDDNVSDAIIVKGRGLQINKDIHVRGDAIFNAPIRTQDVLIAQPPSGGIQPAPESLLKRLEKLETEVQALKEKVETS